MGRPVPAKATRREVAGFIAAPNGQTLAGVADAAVFGPSDLSDEQVVGYWSDTQESINQMRHSVGIVDRLKAKVSLTSLRKVKAR